MRRAPLRLALLPCALLALALALGASPASAAAPASSPSSPVSPPPPPPGRRRTSRRKTGMSGKGVWFSVVSFATAIGWIVSSERETVRSGGLWALAGREAVTAETPKKAPPEGSVVRSPPRPPCLSAQLALTVPPPRRQVHITGQASSTEAVSDSQLSVTTPTPALLLRCAPRSIAAALRRCGLTGVLWTAGGWWSSTSGTKSPRAANTRCRSTRTTRCARPVAVGTAVR